VEIPERVDEWTLDTVKEVVRKHEFEPGRFDYKAYLQPATRTSDPDHIPSIRRTVCSMANAGGGYILFGILDRSIKVRSPDERIVGFPLGKDLLKQFGEKIQAIQPDVYFEASPAPIKLSDPAKGIFVVHIPTSLRRPHMVESTGAFYRRGQGGHAVQMGFYEVRDQMLYTEELRRKVTLLRLVIAQYLAQMEKMRYVAHNQGKVRFDTRPFATILVDASIFFPPSDDLLKDLLDIPIVADNLQEIVESKGAYQASASIEYAELSNLCNKCEHRFNELFGLLGFEGWPPTSS
jgi:hypothetical protein